MKRFVFLFALVLASTSVSLADTSQFYPPPAPGGENGYWVPYSYAFGSTDYPESPYKQPWVDIPLKIESIVSNCDNAVLILNWGADPTMTHTGEIPIVTGGKFTVGLGLTNYGMNLFTRHGFGIISPSKIDPKILQCIYFVSGQRWVPMSSATSK